MGYYVNPRGQTKEQFLEKNGTEIKNPTFAGIAYDEREFEAFTGPSDHRPKKFYHVPFSALQKLGDPQVDTALKQMAA